MDKDVKTKTMETIIKTAPIELMPTIVSAQEDKDNFIDRMWDTYHTICAEERS